MNPPMFEFTDQVVLITGGTRGIGWAMAKRFADAGASLILTGKSNRPTNSIEGSRYIKADFLKKQDIEALALKISSLDKLDVCINNAGINHIQDFSGISNSDYDELIQVNLKAPFLICQSAVSVMEKKQYGRIINVSSIWGHLTKKGRNAYTTTKTGLLGFTRNLSVELADLGILVNALSPGFTLTDLTKASLSPDELNSICRQIPLGRMAAPTEIAEVALFLASKQNQYMTGQNIIVDGGFSIV